jgi:hypothetical protein
MFVSEGKVWAGAACAVLMAGAAQTACERAPKQDTVEATFLGCWTEAADRGATPREQLCVESDRLHHFEESAGTLLVTWEHQDRMRWSGIDRGQPAGVRFQIRRDGEAVVYESRLRSIGSDVESLTRLVRAQPVVEAALRARILSWPVVEEYCERAEACLRSARPLLEGHDVDSWLVPLNGHWICDKAFELVEVVAREASRPVPDVCDADRERR